MIRIIGAAAVAADIHSGEQFAGLIESLAAKSGEEFSFPHIAAGIMHGRYVPVEILDDYVTGIGLLEFGESAIHVAGLAWERRVRARLPMHDILGAQAWLLSLANQCRVPRVTASTIQPSIVRLLRRFGWQHTATVVDKKKLRERFWLELEVGE